MIKSIKASIIITNYNYSKYLARCLRSCFNQSLNRNLYEVILVDDNSSDNSVKVANKFKKEKNFYIIKNKKNLGVAGSANQGILKSNAEFVVRVDADDFVSNDFLRFLIFYLQMSLHFVFLVTIIMLMIMK